MTADSMEPDRFLRPEELAHLHRVPASSTCGVEPGEVRGTGQERTPINANVGWCARGTWDTPDRLSRTKRTEADRTPV